MKFNFALKNMFTNFIDQVNGPGKGGFIAKCYNFITGATLLGDRLYGKYSFSSLLFKMENNNSHILLYPFEIKDFCAYFLCKYKLTIENYLSNEHEELITKKQFGKIVW